MWCVTIQNLYRDRTEGLAWLRIVSQHGVARFNCVAIHQVYRGRSRGLAAKVTIQLIVS